MTAAAQPCGAASARPVLATAASVGLAHPAYAVIPVAVITTLRTHPGAGSRPHTRPSPPPTAVLTLAGIAIRRRAHARPASQSYVPLIPVSWPRVPTTPAHHGGLP